MKTLFPLTLLCLVLAACAEAPTCNIPSGPIKQVQALSPATPIIATSYDGQQISVTYVGEPCDSAYLAYTLEVRTLPPQYRLALQTPNRGGEAIVRRFRTDDFLPGSKFYVGDSIFTKPSRSK